MRIAYYPNYRFGDAKHIPSVQSYYRKAQTEICKTILSWSTSGNQCFLTLLTTMWVYPVFNVSLLWPYKGEHKPPRPIEVKRKAEYKVEKI